MRTVSGHSRTVIYYVELVDQPILIIDEVRIALVLYGIALAGELRALIRDLDQFAFLVFPFVRDRVGLWLTFPPQRKFPTCYLRVPGVAHDFDFRGPIPTLGP